MDCTKDIHRTQNNADAQASAITSGKPANRSRKQNITYRNDAQCSNTQVKKPKLSEKSLPVNAERNDENAVFSAGTSVSSDHNYNTDQRNVDVRAKVNSKLQAKTVQTKLNFTSSKSIPVLETASGTEAELNCNASSSLISPERVVASTNENISNYGSKPQKKLSKSHVWQFFEYNAVTDKSICKKCSQRLHGKFPTNNKKHLSVCDKNAYAEVLLHDNIVKTSAEPSHHATILESMENKYAHKSEKQKKFREALAWFVAANPYPNDIGSNDEFRHMMFIANPKIRVPCRNTVNRDANRLLTSSQEVIQFELKKIKKLTLSSDIWTKRGMSSSFLGVNTTFYHPTLKKKVTLVLGVQKFDSSRHTASDVIREMSKVISKYNIQPNQIWRTMTDGGSNMVCSHRDHLAFFKEAYCPEPLTCRTIEHEHDDSESCETDDESNNVSIEISNYFENNEDNYVENTSADDEIDNNYRRLPCFIHALLTCLIFMEKDESIKPVVQRAKELVSKFSTSHVLTEDLLKLSDVKLIPFYEKRWNYVYLSLARLLELETEVTHVLTNNKKQKYLWTSQQWNEIRTVADFLKVFHEYTNMAEKESAAISSEVVCMIITIHEHLDKYESHPLLCKLAKQIKEKMVTKFSHWLQKIPGTDFEGTFMSATLLDPRFRIVLSNEQAQIAKEFIVTENSQTESAQLGETLVSKKSDESSKYSILTKIRNEKQLHRIAGTNLLGSEIDRYLANHELDNLGPKEDVFKFWENQKPSFPLLAPVALDYLSLGLSIADVERIFSIGGIACQGKRNRLDDNNLAREIILTKNKKLLKIFNSNRNVSLSSDAA